MFIKLAEFEAEAKGCKGLAKVEVPFPMGGIKKEQAHQHLTAAFQQVVDGLLSPSTLDEYVTGSIGKFIEFESDNIDEINSYFVENDWTDGLPVIPPTVERVERMLAKTKRDPNEVIGLMPPFWRETTVENVAVNCVMAGCSPDYFELMLTTVEAMLDKDFNLYGVQTTTNPAGPMVIVNGPARKELGIHSGIGLFGPGWHANATIGRAVRLMLFNIGGARPGIGDMSTLGNPAKYTACIAEFEEESPWESLHVERGFAKDQSTVTVAATTAPYNVIHLGSNAEIYLDELTDVLLLTASNFLIFEMQPVIVISPVHAKMLSEKGYNKQKIREVLWKKARVDLDTFDAKTIEAIQAWKSNCIVDENGKKVVYIAKNPEDIVIVHAGGYGEHSAVMGTFTRSKVTTRAIENSTHLNLKQAAEEVLRTFRPGFQTDGYDIIVTSAEEDKVTLELVLTPEACLDCIMPKDYLENVFSDGIEKKTKKSTKVTLNDPRQ